MNELQTACIVWNVVGCVLIVLGNYYILARRVCMYGMNTVDSSSSSSSTDELTKNQIYRTRVWVWSFFYESINFNISCFSMFLTFVCYVVIFTSIVCNDDNWSYQQHDMTLFAVSNAVFVISSVLYAWLVFWVFKVRASDTTIIGHEHIIFSEVMTMANLFVTAVAASCTTAALSDKEPWVIAASALIAVHCTVIDLLLWGCVWIFHGERKKGISHSLMTNRFFGSEFVAPPSDFFNSVRICYADYNKAQQYQEI